jgi:Lon protease-like protein
MRIPVFPLGLVLMPRMPLPLHIFEERYRRMIGDCLETDSPFGVLLHTGTTIQTVGCMARIESVINRYDDGRLDILTVGTDRFRVSAMHETKVYLEADVDILRDEPLPEELTETISELSEAAMADLAEFARVAGYEVDEQILKDLRPEELSFLLATTDVFSTEEKQQLIELRSTPERMRRAARALDAGRERRAMTNRIRELIGEKSDNIDHLFN